MGTVKDLSEKVVTETRWVNFWKKHPTYRNAANRGLMEQFLADNVMSAASDNGDESLEIAFLAQVRNMSENSQAQAQRLQERTAAEQAEADRLAAEQAEAARIAAEVPNRSWSAERLKAYWEANDPRFAALKPSQPQGLPAEITAEIIQAASADQITRWAKKYTHAVLNDRLAGRA